MNVTVTRRASVKGAPIFYLYIDGRHAGSLFVRTPRDAEMIEAWFAYGADEMQGFPEGFDYELADAAPLGPVTS